MLKTFSEGPWVPVQYGTKMIPSLFTMSAKVISKEFLSRGGSWSGLEEYEGNIVSWMSSDAQLLIYSQNPDTVTVRSSLTSFSKPRTLVVYSDRTGSSSYVIPSDRFTTIDTKVDLAGGMNVIKLHVEEGCDTQYFSIHGEGRRCLGIGFRQISILDGD